MRHGNTVRAKDRRVISSDTVRVLGDLLSGASFLTSRRYRFCLVKFQFEIRFGLLLSGVGIHLVSCGAPLVQLTAGSRRRLTALLKLIGVVVVSAFLLLKSLGLSLKSFLFESLLPLLFFLFEFLL